VFERAAEAVARVDPSRAAPIAPRVSVSALVILASGAAVASIWRALST
jgi:hypothetical protein